MGLADLTLFRGGVRIVGRSATASGVISPRNMRITGLVAPDRIARMFDELPTVDVISMMLPVTISFYVQMTSANMTLKKVSFAR